MAFRKKFTKKTGYRKKGGYRKKRSFKKKSTFRKRVARVVESTAEKKYVVSIPTTGGGDVEAGTLSSLQNATPQSAFGTNQYCLSPSFQNAGSYGWNIPGGSGPGQRIGRKIRPHKTVLRYSFCVAPYDVTYNPYPTPVIVKMYIFTCKQIPLAFIPYGNFVAIGGNFLNDGALNVPLTGTLPDLCMGVSSDYTLLKTKIFKLGAETVTVAAGGLAPNFYGANNDFQYNCTGRMNISKCMPKQIVWDDSGNTLTKSIWMLLQVIPADGSACPAVASRLVRANYAVEMSYTDL
jgi:hypothetical protein